MTSTISAFFWLLRPNRTPMLAIITSAAAFAAGAGISKSLWMALIGFCLAAGGFSLDYLADRDLDLEGVRAAQRRNPLAEGKLSPRAGLIFSLSSIFTSLIMLVFISPPSIYPWLFIVLVIYGLAVHWFETPLMRAFTLGILQALYILMGALAGQLSTGLVLLSLMFFFAMFAGRGLTDIRDYPLDDKTRVLTLPKRYGIRKTTIFIFVGLLIAHVFGLSAYWTGEFHSIYLYIMLAATLVGLTCSLIFIAKPSPHLAHIFTIVFMVGEGLGITLALILGSI
jgi:4-hydroxybenzoate polyprenyltransferase